MSPNPTQTPTPTDAALAALRRAALDPDLDADARSWCGGQVYGSAVDRLVAAAEALRRAEPARSDPACATCGSSDHGDDPHDQVDPATGTCGGCARRDAALALHATRAAAEALRSAGPATAVEAPVDAGPPAELVHIEDAGFPLCARSHPKGSRWKVGRTVRQHALATCPDCLGER